MSSWWSGCVLLMWWCGASSGGWADAGADRRRRASAFKELREPSGVSFEFILWRPLSLSAGLPSRRRLLDDKDVASSIISFTVAWTARR
jgi:hypothetical protein